jgi:hypothetical protein
LEFSSEGEIKAFLNAQERIQALTQAYGIPSEVSAFAYYSPFLMKEERRPLQLANQRNYRLPIIHSQTPVQMENALSYSEQERIRTGKQSILATTIEHVARLREYSPDVPCSMDVHIGTIVAQGGSKSDAIPSIYSPEEFMARREELYTTAKTTFAHLTALAKKHGMPLLLENVPAVVMYPDYHDGEPRLQYLPFHSLAETLEVSKNNITFDTAHWAAAKATQRQFTENGVDPALLFLTAGVHDWQEYSAALGTFEAYLSQAKAIHLSNTNGIGVKLNKHPELAKRWGDWGTDDGLLSKEQLRTCITHAQQQHIPVMLEVDYDIKRIPENCYKEADAFLRYALE